MEYELKQYSSIIFYLFFPMNVKLKNDIILFSYL